ncbi:hypothetical protein C5706_11730 [Klebsiella pneumoniae]|nr:hypothetical protein C5706_11730 [Klebsiella pneumoniae]
MTIITKKRLIAAGVLSALIAGNMAMAADVPAGVQLAEKQTLVRNSGAQSANRKLLRWTEPENGKNRAG